MKREALGGILFAAIILFIVMSLEAPGTKFGNAWQYLTSGNQSQQSTGGQSSYQPPATGTGGSSVVGSPHSLLSR